MIKLLTVIGARPQIIKAAAISRSIKEWFFDRVEEKILHTGQHYDANMSQVFFDELGIPAPHYNLNVGSGIHGVQTAKMIEGIEQVLLSEKFDGIILYGDTNSTLAGAVAASKLHIPIYHIEAGLRSFNMSMPEEVNRIVCDQLSTILFAPTQTAVDNLCLEGFNESKAVFADGRMRRVILSGDVMYDNSMYFASKAENESGILEEHGIEKNNFILVTIHRDNNTDNPKRLNDIFRALLYISEQNSQQIVLPLHPRTKKMLSINLKEDLQNKLLKSSIKIIPPASFLDMIMLEKSATMVMTDSGGVQKEAFFFKKPCVILRPETEWIEIIQHGAGVLADADYDRIIEGYNAYKGKEVVFPMLFGDANASKKIIECILIRNK